MNSRHRSTAAIYFSNITSWSDKAQHELAFLGHKVAAFIAVETHLVSNRTGAAAALLRARGWTPFASPATPSPDSENGTHGGVLAGTRCHVAAGPLPDAGFSSGAWSSPQPQALAL